MRILVTRPKEHAEETAAKLRARGHTVLVAPLLEIRFAAGPEILLDGVPNFLGKERTLAPKVYRVGLDDVEADESSQLFPRHQRGLIWPPTRGVYAIYVHV